MFRWLILRGKKEEYKGTKSQWQNGGDSCKCDWCNGGFGLTWVDLVSLGRIVNNNNNNNNNDDDASNARGNAIVSSLAS